jgi:hypothetical protein
MSFPRNTYVVYTKKTLTNENNIKRMNSVPLSPAASTIFFVRHSFSDSTVTLPMYTFHVGTSAFASRADRCLAFLCPLLRCSREQQHRWCFPMCWPWASLKESQIVEMHASDVLLMYGQVLFCQGPFILWCKPGFNLVFIFA